MSISLRNTFNLHYWDGFVQENLCFDFYELIYLVNGSGETIINGETHPYSSHMVCLTQPGDIRNHYCSKHTDYYCIRFFSPSLPVDLKSGLYKIHSSDIQNIFKNIYGEFIKKDVKYFEICNLHITELIYKLSRLQTTNVEDETLLKLIREIDASPTYNLSVQEMADKVAYSYDHFRHKFKELTGQPPTTYVINSRIMRACELLTGTELSCTEIANTCGFSTSAQLSAQFKKYIGMSPLSYRKSYQGLS